MKKILSILLTPVTLLLFTCMSANAQVWERVPLRLLSQRTADFDGGEGQQWVLDIKWSSTNANVVYMSTDTSQVWKSSDGGTTWHPKHNGIWAFAILSLGVSPYDENIVFGAGSSRHTDTNTEQGIYRTIDGGDTWTKVKHTPYPAPLRDGRSFFAFKSATEIYASTEVGLMKSTDSGATWAVITTTGYNFSGKIIGDIKIHPTDNNILFVHSRSSDLLYSLNLTTLVATQTGTGLPSGKIALAIVTANPSIMYMVCGINGLYKSINGGSNFSQILTISGRKALYIEISPADTNYAYVTWTEAGDFMGQTYYSRNANTTGTTNWTISTSYDIQNSDGWITYWKPSRPEAKAAPKASPIAAHPTNRDIAIIIAGRHTLSKTINAGQTWSYSSDGYTGGLAGNTADQEDITAFGWDANDSNRFVIANADYGVYLTTDGGNTFALKESGYGMLGVAIQPTINSQIFVATGHTGASYTNNGIFVSTAAGTLSSWVLKVAPDGKMRTSIFFDRKTANNGNIVYSGNYKSTNAGSTWTILSRYVATMYIGTYAGSYSPVYAIPSSGGIITIYRSDDAGTTWTTNTVSNPSVQYTTFPYTYGSQITVSPDNPDKLYYADPSRGVRIINGTTSTFAQGIENEVWPATGTGTPATVLVTVDPNNANIVYVGKYRYLGYPSKGVYRSINGGTDFIDITGNLGSNFSPMSMSVNPYNNYLYIGSHLGTWRLPPPGDAGTGTPGSPPTVVTGTATAVTTTTATLHAEVNPNGSSTTAIFQYGTSPGSYTVSTGSQTVGAGTSSVGVQQTLTGLSGSTTYYVRCQANSINGSTSGSETTFATDQRLSLDVSMGTPTVNGSLSDWSAITNPIAVVISGTVTAGNGSWATKWNATGLHLAFVGSDTTSYADSGSNTYLDDGFELYINRDGNLESTSYDGFDAHWGWNRHGTFTRAYNGTTTGILIGTSTADGGYIIEVTIPWAIFPGGSIPGSATTIGADVQLNDDNNGGNNRECAKGWNAETGVDTDYYNPSSFGKFILLGEEEEGSETTNTRLGTVSTLISHWKLDEGTGNTIRDSIGSNHGTNTGGAWVTPGLVGTSSLDFERNDVDNVTMGTNSALNISGAEQSIYLGGWFKKESSNSSVFGAIASRWIAGSRQYLFVVSNSASAPKINFRLSNNGVASTSLEGSTTIGTGTTNHLMGVYDAVANSMTVYLNGVSDGVGTHTTGIYSNGTSSFNVGTFDGSNGLDGVLDEVIVGSGTVSVQEIINFATKASVVTGSATTIAQTSMILNGSVTPNGSSSTQGFFQTGTVSGIYTGTSTYITLGTDSTALALSRTITGLSGSTEYFYRAVSWNGVYEIYGSQTSATTTSGDAASPIGTVTINSNGTYTIAIAVTLNLSATDDVGVVGYYLSGSTTTPTAGQAGWIAVGTDTTYSDNIPYTLSAEDGTKTVNVWYKDGVSNVSAMASDTIILDLTYPSISILSPSSVYTMTDGGKALGTTAASVVINGSSSDTNGVGTVTISNSATTTTWTVSGTNTFTTTRKILPILSDGLVGYWKLDEITGSIAYDYSPLFTANGTITGAAVGTLSVFGGSRYFDGVDDSISIGDPSDGHLDFGTGSFSFSFWVYVGTHTGAYDTPFDKGVSTPGYSVELGSGTWDAYISNGSVAAIQLSATPFYNQWKLLTVVVDRIGANLKGFVDDVQIGTTSISSWGAGSSTSGSSSLLLGDVGERYKGYLDDVRIYNRALSDAEVLQLYQLTNPDQINTFSLTAQDVPGNQGTDTVSIGAFPAITTADATEITRNSATLNSTCNANNGTTTVWFDYGIVSGDYTGSSTTGTVTGAVDTAVNISLGALASGTTIYYRACATNAVGTVYGSEFSFDTLSGITTNGEYDYRSLFNSTRFREFLKRNDIYLIFMKKMKSSEDWENLVNDPDGFLSNLVNTPNP